MESSPSFSDLVLMVQDACSLGSCPSWEVTTHWHLPDNCEESWTLQLYAIKSKHRPLVTLPGVKGPWSPNRRKMCIILINKEIFKNFLGSRRFIGRVKLNTTTKTGYQGISLALMFTYSLTSQHLIFFLVGERD